MAKVQGNTGEIGKRSMADKKIKARKLDNRKENGTEGRKG
jgi:hypothetical protein